MAKKKGKFTRKEREKIREKAVKIAKRTAKRKGTTQTKEMPEAILKSIKKLFPERKRKTKAKAGTKFTANEQECMSILVPWFIRNFENKFPEKSESKIKDMAIAAAISTCAPEKSLYRKNKLGEFTMVNPVFHNPMMGVCSELEGKKRRRRKYKNHKLRGKMGQIKLTPINIIFAGVGGLIGKIGSDILDDILSTFTPKFARQAIWTGGGGLVSLMGIMTKNVFNIGAGLGLVYTGLFSTEESKLKEAIKTAIEGGKELVNESIKQGKEIHEEGVQFFQGIIEYMQNKELEEAARRGELENMFLKKSHLELTHIKRILIKIGIMSGNIRTSASGKELISIGSEALAPDFRELISAIGEAQKVPEWIIILFDEKEKIKKMHGDQFVKFTLLPLTKTYKRLLLVKAQAVASGINTKDINPSVGNNLLKRYDKELRIPEAIERFIEQEYQPGEAITMVEPEPFETFGFEEEEFGF